MTAVITQGLPTSGPGNAPSWIALKYRQIVLLSILPALALAVAYVWQTCPRADERTILFSFLACFALGIMFLLSCISHIREGDLSVGENSVGEDTVWFLMLLLMFMETFMLLYGFCLVMNVIDNGMKLSYWENAYLITLIPLAVGFINALIHDKPHAMRPIYIW